MRGSARAARQRGLDGAVDVLGRGELVVEARIARDHEVVVALDERSRGRRARPRDHQREPAALGELLDDGDGQDRHAEREPDEVDGQVALPLLGCSLRCWIQNLRHREFESENVRNTLIEYMTTSLRRRRRRV